MNFGNTLVVLLYICLSPPSNVSLIYISGRLVPSPRQGKQTSLHPQQVLEVSPQPHCGGSKPMSAVLLGRRTLRSLITPRSHQVAPGQPRAPSIRTQPLQTMGWVGQSARTACRKRPSAQGAEGGGLARVRGQECTRRAFLGPRASPFGGLF